MSYKKANCDHNIVINISTITNYKIKDIILVHQSKWTKT